MIQQYRLGLVWTHHATQADRPSIGCRRHDIGALDASQLLQHCRRAISQPRPARPPLQCLAQDIGEEADQQMCLHSPGRLVPDRPNAEIVLMDAEGGLRIREMHIGTPQFFLVPIRDVASQQIAALTGPRPGLSRGASRPANDRPAVGPRCHYHAEQPRRSRVSTQQPSHTTFDRARVAASPPAGRADLHQPCADAGHEPLAHGLFFGRAGGAAAKDEGFDAVAGWTALDLESVADRFPATLTQSGGKLLQAAPRRADNVTRATSAQRDQCRLADHAAVQNPDPPFTPVAILHPRHDLLDRGAVVTIAGEHLITQRVTIASDDQADQHLLAVASVVARVAASCLGVGGRFTLEVGAGDIVEQQVIVQTKQASQPALKMHLQSPLAGQQPVEGAVQAVVIDFVVADTQQVAKGGATKPILGDMQLAGRFAEASEDEHRGHLSPGNLLAAGAQPIAEYRVEFQRLPEAEPQPEVAKPPAAFQAKAAQVDGHGFGRRRLVEQAGLAFDADDRLCEGTGPDPAGSIEFTELGNRLLTHLAAQAHGANQSPIGMHLAVLVNSRVPEIHERPSWTTSLRHCNRVGWHYIRSGQERTRTSKDLRRLISTK